MIEMSAMKASDSRWVVDTKRKLEREEINGMDIVAWDGPVHFIDTHASMLAAVRALKKESLLGFDTETRPAYRKGQSFLPSLLQLAGKHDVYIFQLKQCGDLTKLFKLLSSRMILKAGVAVVFDVRELRKLHEFTPRGFVDLGNCARHAGMHHHGLRGLAALMLGKRITKGAQRTNWAKTHLPVLAIKYAATDAWIGRKIYRAMKKNRVKLPRTKFD